MTGAAGEGPGAYELSFSQALAQRLKDLHRQAAQTGRGDQFRAALAALAQRLRADPLEVGELIRAGPNVRLLQHAARVYPLQVRFAIHQDLPIVFLLHVRLLPP